MRRAANLDRSHGPVVSALNAAGIKVQSLASMGGGVPDLLCGFRSIVCLLEVKNGDDGPARRALTKQEQDWHDTWPGHVAIAYTPEQAVLEVLNHARKCGVL